MNTFSKIRSDLPDDRIAELVEQMLETSRFLMDVSPYSVAKDFDFKVNLLRAGYMRYKGEPVMLRFDEYTTPVNIDEDEEHGDQWHSLIDEVEREFGLTPGTYDEKYGDALLHLMWLRGAYTNMNAMAHQRMESIEKELFDE